MTASALRVELLQSKPQLAAIADSWRPLAERQGNAFLTPEWFGAWQSHYGATATPVVAAVRRPDGELVAVMPLAADRNGLLRTLRFGGANLGDRFGPAGSADPRALGAAVGEALSQATAWSAIVLENVAADAPWLDAWCESQAPRLRTISLRRDVLPAIDLAGLTWEDFLAARSRNLRSQLGRKRRRLEKEHSVHFRLTDDPVQLSTDLESFFRLHDARWAPQGGSGSLTERSRAFHSTFAATALERGWLRLWILEIDSQPAAAWYGWLIGGVYSYYLAGFDPGWSTHSVGMILLAQTIRSAIEEGARRYDLLLGGEAYKSRFATEVDEVKSVALVRRRRPAGLVVSGEVALRGAAARVPPGVRRPLRWVRRLLPSEAQR